MAGSVASNRANLEKARLAKQSVGSPAIARIRLADDGERSAHGAYCCKKLSRPQWIAEHDLFVADDGRAYALVDTRTEVFFMDAITGALVALGSGVHQTNEVKRVGGFRRDHAGAAEILFRAFRDDDPGEESGGMMGRRAGDDGWPAGRRNLPL